MAESENVQRESCTVQFKEIFRRLDTVERYNVEKQDEKIDKFSQAMIRYEVLFDKQNETIKSIMEQFDTYRKENIQTGKERDSVMRDMVESLNRVYDQLQSHDGKINNMVDKINSIDDKSKVDFLTIAKSAFILVVTGGFASFITYMFLMYRSVN